MSDQTTESKKLLPEFPPVTADEWRIAAEKALKGAPFEKRMITRTPEGIDIRAIYTQDDRHPHVDEQAFPGLPPFRRGAQPAGHTHDPWRVAQELPYLTVEEYNAAIRADCERGQTSVTVRLDAASRSGNDPDEEGSFATGEAGLSLTSVETLEKMFLDVPLMRYPLLMEAGAAGPVHLALLAAYLTKRGIPLAGMSGVVGADPLGHLARLGSLPASLDSLYDRMAVATAWARRAMPGMRTVAVSGEPYHDAGASSTEELACVLATGADTMRALLSRGVSPEDAVCSIIISLGLGPHFFMEIAKLRAARETWTAVATAFGCSPDASAPLIHVRTSRFSVTAIDPYVNMLRATTEAMAGAIGGCDSMHVGFFDDAVRMPDEFSRRIARNTQTILQEEANLHRVIDPAGGSWYVEHLTDQLATAAWTLFQEIEKAGGMAEALRAGSLQQRINATATRKAEAVAHRKETLVGLNVYANPDEQILERPRIDVTTYRHDAVHAVRALRSRPGREEALAAVERLASLPDGNREREMDLAIAAAAAGATLGELSRAWRARTQDAVVIAEPLPSRRVSAGFEELRKKVAAYAARTGSPPTLFLAAMGPVAQHKARADFSAGFLAAGGCTVITPEGLATPDAAAEGAVQSGARGMVICSTDETYPGLVPAVCARVRKMKPEMVIVLAGYPQEHVEGFRAAGVDAFIHLRANALQVLTDILGRMGVLA